MDSMTGFGRGEAEQNGHSFNVEIKSVNHRYLETNIRIPHALSTLEAEVRKTIKERLTRGKVDVFVTVDSDEEGDVDVKVNEALLRSYLEAFRHISEEYGIPNDVTALSVARFPDVLTVEKKDLDADAVSEGLLEITERALCDFDAMRLREGEKLRDDVLLRLETIDALVTTVERESPKTLAEYRARLEAKMAEVLGGAGFDESRILTEAAIFADRIAVDEETIRLRSHMSQLSAMVSGDSPTGRKIDFLVQEFNREANTIGSKCQNSDIAHTVVDLKSEIEKIREQIQNIE